MPRFDRSVLARFLPNPKAIADFEQLNKSVDVVLPEQIGEASNLAQEAARNAAEALAQVGELSGRVSATELLPVANPHHPPDDVSPPTIQATPQDDLAPVFNFAGPGNDLAPAHFHP